MKHRSRILSIIILVAAIGTSGYMLLRGTSPAPPADPPPPPRYDTTETDWNDYLWPTNAGTVRTSDFAEFRSTHFHAGIDVSTNGRTGYDVYAARDGILHSMYFEPGGYGWFLTLRHEDGYYTCYAHLKGFPDRIRDAFRAQLAREDRSYGTVRWTRDTVRVKKGEVIAFTGATGAGPAHLHFEVRDPDFNPVNPGLSPHLRPADSIPPELRQLCIVPLDAASAIDDEWTQQMYNLAGGGSSYRLRAVPVIRGRAGLMLRAHDRAEGATDYPTPYKLTMYVDGREVFAAVSNRFADSLGFHIRIDRDNWLMRARKGEFRKLFREEGNALETYLPRDRQAGELSAAALGAGPKRIMIVAEDLAGNRSMLSMTVMIAADIRLTHALDGRTLTLRTDGAPASLLIEEDGPRGWDAARQFDSSAARAGVTLDLGPYRGSRIRAVTVDAFGNRIVQGTWAPGGLKRSAGRLYPHREILYDEIVYELKTAVPFAAPPIVSITQGTRREIGRVFALADDTYRAVLPTWPGFAGEAEVTVAYRVGNKQLRWTDAHSGFHISADIGGQVRSDDGRFILTFDRGDVYRSLLCSIERVSDTLDAWTVGPADMPLAGRPLASILPARPSSKLMVDADYPVRHYGSVDIPHSPAIAARFGRWLGTYRLTYDDEGPDISAAVVRRSREPVRISITDEGAGVDWDAVAVYIDSALVPVEYDERRDILFVPYDVYKDLGRGLLTIRAGDRIGNTSVMKKNM